MQREEAKRPAKIVLVYGERPALRRRPMTYLRVLQISATPASGRRGFHAVRLREYML